MRGFLVIGWLMVAGVLLAACSSGSTAPPASSGATSGAALRVSNPPEISLSPAPTSSAQIVLPLDAYGFAKQDSAVIDKAQSLLIADCMKAKGFTYQTSVDTSQAKTIEHNEPFGVIDPARAASYGYHDPSMLNGSKKFGGAKPSWMTDAYLVALQGWSTPPAEGAKTPTGCQDEALGKLAVDRHADPDLVGQLAVAAAARTAADPRVSAVQAKWSACMAAKGYSFATPQAAATAAWSAATEPPTATEVATATADVSCKQQSDLVSIWLAVESAYQQLGIEQNAATLAQVRSDGQAEVARAQAVLASH